MSPKVQLIIVIVILVAVLAWTILKMFSKDSGGSACGGCALSDNCSKKELKGKKPKTDCRQ